MRSAREGERSTAGRRLRADQRRPPHPVAGTRQEQTRRGAHCNLRRAAAACWGTTRGATGADHGVKAASEVVHGQVSVLYMTSLGTSATTVLNSLLLLSYPVLFLSACCLLPQALRTTPTSSTASPAEATPPGNSGRTWSRSQQRRGA